MTDTMHSTHPIPLVRIPHPTHQGRHHIGHRTEVRHLAARFLPDGERFQQLARTLTAGGAS
jgi:hypothetical protein